MSFTGQSTYQASLLGSQDGRLVTVEGKVTTLEGKTTTLEGKVTTIETNIQNSVQSVINDLVATNVYADLSTALLDTTSNLSAALATKVAATVQVQVDTAQNDLINGKVEQSDYDAYVTNNDAAVASKVKQSDYDTFVSTVTADVNSKVLQSTYDTYVSTNDAAVASKVDQSDYDTFVSLTTSNLDTKASQSSLNNYISSNDAAVASKVAQNDYDSFVYTTDSTLNTKADLSSFNSYVASNDATVALKADQSALTAYISSNNAAVASKVAKSAYDSKISSMDDYIYNYEQRLNAVEEYIRAMLATYTIGLPDGTNYVYTGVNQKLSTPPPPFEVVGIRPYSNDSWFIGIQFTQNGYNSLAGGVKFNLPLMKFGGGINIWSQGNINPHTLYGEMPMPGTRVVDTLDWKTSNHPLPFNIEYIDTKEVVLYSKTFTQTLFDSLPKLQAWTPETPQNASYNSTTKKLTFTVSNAYAIDFVDLNINGTWYRVEETDVVVSFDRLNDGVADNGSEPLNIDRVTIDLHRSPVPVTGNVEIVTRYDKFTGNGNAGFAQITVA